MYHFKSNIFLLIIISLLSCIISDPINLSDYKFPVKDSSDKLIRIAILGTNDFHGGIFPIQYNDINNNYFKHGGALHLYSYAKILQQQWENQFLWLDGGDQFQGTMECMLSNCEIMKDYFNNAGVQGIGLGNHDFDYGLDYFKNYIETQKFPVLVANVKIKDGPYLYEAWKNVEAYHIYEFDIGVQGTIKIGVIGLATKTTPSQTDTDVSSLEFEDYYKVTKEFEKILREEKKVDAVILLTHFGPLCENDIQEKMILQMRDSTTQQRECKESEEIMSFLQQIKDDETMQIDGVVAAHVHDVVHHWISGIPVVESSGSDYFNILYLPFRKVSDNFVLQTNKIVIEGPVPVCEKLWPVSKNCEYKYEDSTLMEDFVFHGNEVKLDDELAEKLKYWNDIIDEKIKNTVFETKDEMFTDNDKETLLTNFINDIAKIITDSDICFYNLGGLRTTWYKGIVNEIDLFRMLPFNNTWVRFEMTGEEVFHLFQNLATSIIYPSSGVLRTFNYENKYYTLKNLMLWDGEEGKLLDLKKTYRICTNNFLANGGSAMGKVRKWYTELRNRKDFGIIRELAYKYLKNVRPITKEKFVNEKYPRNTILDN